MNVVDAKRANAEAAEAEALRLAFENLMDLSGRSATTLKSNRNMLRFSEFHELCDLPQYYTERIFHLCNNSNKDIRAADNISFDDVQLLFRTCRHGSFDEKVGIFFDSFRGAGRPYVAAIDLIAAMLHVPDDKRTKILQSLRMTKIRSMATALEEKEKSLSLEIEQTQIVPAGWMWKLGRKSHILKGRRWKRRWFRLVGNSLQWSKTPQSKVKGSVRITASHSLFKISSPFPDTFGFRLWCSDVSSKDVRKEMRLIVKRAGDVRQWMDSLRSSIDCTASAGVAGRNSSLTAPTSLHGFGAELKILLHTVCGPRCYEASRYKLASFFRCHPMWLNYFIDGITRRVDAIVEALVCRYHATDIPSSIDAEKSSTSVLRAPLDATFFFGEHRHSYRGLCELRQSVLVMRSASTSKSAAFVVFVNACFVEDVNRGTNLSLVSACGNIDWKLKLELSSPKDRTVWAQALRRVSCGNSEHRTFTDLYAVLSKIGRGRTSTVYTCTERRTKKTRVVKIIDKKESAFKFADICMLRSERRLLSKIRHEHIISAVAYFESSEKLWLVMEKHLQGTLLERIRGKPVMREGIAARTIRGILEAVAYLHNHQIAHRDLKPENILCGENVWDVYVADFGFACSCASGEWMTSPVGTVAYCAPEILMGLEYQKSCDMWSVGVILYVLLRGRMPFNNKQEIVERPIKSVHVHERFAKKKESRFRIRRPQETTVVIPRKETRSMFEHVANSVLGPCEDSLSANCVNFISCCLERDTSRRISALRALEHPWIKSFATTEVQRNRVVVCDEEGLRGRERMRELSKESAGGLHENGGTRVSSAKK